MYDSNDEPETEVSAPSDTEPVAEAKASKGKGGKKGGKGGKGC